MAVRSPAPLWQALPLTVVLAVFFVAPLLMTLIVSVFDYNDYAIIPAFTLRNYQEMFEGCASSLPDMCTTLKTYVSTAGFCFAAWALTLGIGFTVPYFLVFHVRTDTTRMVLALLCTIPFWTSNVIRMISWIPLLGRNGVVNQALMGLRLVETPQEWLLYSPFSVLLAFVHLNTFFMIVPILNSMSRIDKSLLEAASDAGASAWQILWNVVVPLSKSGIVIGSIFVVVIVMGDFVTIGVMGGEQIASVGKTIQVHMSYLQFPAAAAQAVVLLCVVIAMIATTLRFVDIRGEL